MLGSKSLPSKRLSFNDAVEIVGDFLEVALSTLFYLRNLYQPSLFTRVKAYDVPVYQCRHPQVRAFIAGFVGTALAEIKRGAIESITLVISSISTGEPLERFLFELDYMDLTRFRNEADKSIDLDGSPSQTELKLILQGFLTRLCVLEGQLTALDPQDISFNLLMTLKKGLQPSSFDGKSTSGSRLGRDHRTRGANDQEPEGSPWTPASRNLRNADPAVRSDEGITTHSRIPEPVRPISSVETGIIDLNLMVQECRAKAAQPARSSLPSW